jgi:hypothetical protein
MIPSRVSCLLFLNIVMIKALPLLDLDDLKKVLQYVTDDPQGKSELSSNYGSIASASLGAILRSIVAWNSKGQKNSLENYPLK